eukprot:gb/GECH01012864.1/.p1 GENE.gb/GECH01012864.1/~~gb/GECH01012864.1/.p1  ORF type:complete len:743 (+),score=213.58 gb/GECH01012864.1/:1-2229(+)
MSETESKEERSSPAPLKSKPRSRPKRRRRRPPTKRPPSQVLDTIDQAEREKKDLTDVEPPEEHIETKIKWSVPDSPSPEELRHRQPRRSVVRKNPPGMSAGAKGGLGAVFNASQQKDDKGVRDVQREINSKKDELDSAVKHLKVEKIHTLRNQIKDILQDNTDALENTEEGKKYYNEVKDYLDGVSEHLYIKGHDILNEYITQKKTVFDRVAKTKDAKQAFDIIDREDLSISPSVMDEGYLAEKREFRKTVRGNMKEDKLPPIVMNLIDLIVDIWEVEQVISHFDEIAKKSEKKRESKKMLKHLNETHKNMKKFVESAAVRANNDVIYTDQKKLDTVVQLFNDLEEMLGKKDQIERDRIWYLEHLPMAFKSLNELEIQVTKALNLDFIKGIELDPELEKTLQRKVPSELKSFKSDVERLKKNNRAKYAKLGSERGQFAAEYGLKELYNRIYEIVTKYVLTNYSESEKKYLFSLTDAKYEWESKRKEALKDLRERDELLLQRIKEAADSMREEFDEHVVNLRTANDLADRDEIDFEDIVNSNFAELNEHRGTRIWFQEIERGLLGTFFKDPNDEEIKWDSSFSRKVNKSKDWQKAVNTFITLESKVLKKHGVPEISNVSYGYCPTGDDPLIRYHQERMQLSPLPLDNFTAKKQSGHKVNFVAQLSGISRKTFERTIKRRKCGHEDDEEDTDDNMVDICIQEEWPGVSVVINALREDYAVWVNGKCSLSNVNYKGIVPGGWGLL